METKLSDADLSEALAIAMEPEAWLKVNSGISDGSYNSEDGARCIRSIRHASAAMELLRKLDLI